MVWAKLAAAGNFFTAAAALFIAWGLYLGNARTLFVDWSAETLDQLMYGFFGSFVLFVVCGGLLLRDRAAGAYVALVLYAGGVVAVVHQAQAPDNAPSRSIPLLVAQALVILVNARAAWALATRKAPAVTGDRASGATRSQSG